MMNTYDTSEYLAKAKLAVADSWKREGGAHGMAQAEAEYKDFILFYPNMEESAEAQFKICEMQYQQMDKADRDPLHARQQGSGTVYLAPRHAELGQVRVAADGDTQTVHAGERTRLRQGRCDGRPHGSHRRQRRERCECIHGERQQAD
jgi:hypothetical protein